MLYLTKPIGNGILVSAHRAKKFFHKPPPLDEAIRWMTTLNRDAAKAMVEAGASAATDVTGYGLIGHLLEMCEGSGTGAELRASAVPVLDRRARGAGARLPSRRHRAQRRRPSATACACRSPESELTLMCDAQTSGGLLIAIAPERAAALETKLRRRRSVLCKGGDDDG